MKELREYFLRPSESDRASACPAYLELKKSLDEQGLLPEFTENKYSLRGTELHGDAQDIIEGLKEGKYIWDYLFPLMTNEDSFAEEALGAVTDALSYLSNNGVERIDYDNLLTEVKKEAYFQIGSTKINIAGTADLIYKSDRTLYLFDYKFGSTQVFSETSQLLFYALLFANPSKYDTITVGIIQNGEISTKNYHVRDEVDEISLTIEERFSFFKEGKELYLQKGKHCKYCPCKANCKEFSSIALTPFQSKVTPENIPMDQVENLLPVLEYAVEVFRNRIRNILMEGGELQKYYLSKSTRTARAFDDYPAVLEVLRDNNLPLYQEKEFTPASLEKTIGKGLYTKHFLPLVTHTVTETVSIKEKTKGDEKSITNQDLLEGMI